MGLLRLLHVVCLFSLLSRAWRAEGQTLQLSCSKQLGADVPSNPKAPTKGNEPQVCVSRETCCTKQTEDSLKARAEHDIKTSLLTKYKSAQSSLSSLSDDLKEYFQSVIREGHRHSALFLLNTQKNLTTAEVNVISRFFKDLENYLVDDKMKLQDIVNSFFRDSFPLVLEYINPAGKTISNVYVECLKKNMVEIQPFGRRPSELVDISEAVFEPVRKLLSSLKFGEEMISMAQGFNFTSGCENTLLQMKFCSLCQGQNEQVKPCHNFCMDTLRNCLTSELELQREWGTFIDAVSSLARTIGKSNLENFSNAIYKDLWNAAMYVLIQRASVMTKALDKCGTPTYIDAAPSKTSKYTESVSPTPYVTTRVFAKMENVKTRVEFLKTLFQDLPERMCVMDGVAAQQSQVDNCWNGRAMTKYTGLDTKRASFRMTPGDARYLALLLVKIQEEEEAIKKYTEGKDDDDDDSDDEESTSVSTSGENEIDGSVPCDRDDEDCGSSSTSENGVNGRSPIEGESKDNDDIYMVGSTQADKENPTGDVYGGGVENPNKKPGKAQPAGNSSSIQENSLLLMLFLVVFVFFSRK